MAHTIYKRPSQSSLRYNQAGVAFTEAVIALPLFLLLVFGCYAAAVWFNTTASLSTAVPRAQLAAGSRGKVAIVPNQVAMMVEQWKSSPEAMPRAELMALLVSPGIDSFFAMTNLDQIATSSCSDPNNSEGGGFSGGEGSVGGGHGAMNPGGAGGVNNANGNLTYCPYQHFKELPTHYILTWIYIAESMRLSIGDSLRYPWNPAEAPALFCSFIPPNRPLGSANPLEWSLNAVVCEVGPNIPGINAINRMIALLSGSRSESSQRLTITVANWTSVDNAINGT